MVHRQPSTIPCIARPTVICTEEEEVGEGEEDDEEAAERRRLVQEERRKQKMYQRAVKVWGSVRGTGLPYMQFLPAHR